MENIKERKYQKEMLRKIFQYFSYYLPYNLIREIRQKRKEKKKLLYIYVIYNSQSYKYIFFIFLYSYKV